jgi:cell wall-active antibiotic response 4TMS protein YvqF
VSVTPSPASRASSASPPTLQRRHRHGGIVGPLLLITIGTVALLQNAGYLPSTAWLGLLRLWPLVLVLAGVELLLAHRIPWLALAALAVVVVIAGGYVGGVARPQTAALASPRTIVTNLDDANAANVVVRWGAGALDIGPLLQPPAGQLASVTYDGPPDFAPMPRYNVSGGVGHLDYTPSGRGPSLPFTDGGGQAPHMQLDLNTGVPISSLNVQTGATNAHIDLSALHIANLDVAAGAAAAWIRLPESGATAVHVSGGMGTVTLEIPQGVPAQIRYRGGLSTLNIDQQRFVSVGNGIYRSTDFSASAPNRADINIETGLTTIQVQ